MKTQRWLVTLTLINFAMLLVTVMQLRPAVAASNEVAPVLRGRALQIVDERGKVRASVEVMPASKQPNGEMYPETVLLRLITEQGRPSVKISASEELAGLTFVGPTGTKDTYLQLFAKGQQSSLRLKDEDGGERIVAP